jgi:hypothetical protein
VLESTGSVEREEEESALGWGRGPSWRGQRDDGATPSFTLPTLYLGVLCTGSNWTASEPKWGHLPPRWKCSHRSPLQSSGAFPTTYTMRLQELLWWWDFSFNAAFGTSQPPWGGGGWCGHWPASCRGPNQAATATPPTVSHPWWFMCTGTPTHPTPRVLYFIVCTMSI